MEIAKGGTLFLDEIGDTTPYMQQTLLRFLQEEEFTPVGGTTKKSDVRIIAATNRDLLKECENRKFRWDLYYRLTTTELELPTMQQRGIEAKKQLMKFFIKKKKEQLNKSFDLKFDNEVKALLLGYPFPGNLRELENLIAGLYVFAEPNTFITLAHLPTRLTNMESEESYNWEIHEKNLIRKTLKHTKGNQLQACKLIGYGSINTLKSKIKKYGVMF